MWFAFSILFLYWPKHRIGITWKLCNESETAKTNPSSSNNNSKKIVRQIQCSASFCWYQLFCVLSSRCSLPDMCYTRFEHTGSVYLFICFIQIFNCYFIDKKNLRVIFKRNKIKHFRLVIICCCWKKHKALEVRYWGIDLNIYFS